jgi:hypothetical protein
LGFVTYAPTMDAQGRPLGGEEPAHDGLQGYSRAEVDDFLSAVASERTRLEAAIADANRRIAGARSSISMHRVMVAMLLDAQREFLDVRNRAQSEADEIVAAAELEARATIEAARAPGMVDERAGDAADDAPPPAIDLISGSEPTPGPTSFHNGSPPSSAPDDAAGFFDYLRGALVDDQPLGPVDEIRR